MDEIRREVGEVDARGGRARHRRPWRAAQARIAQVFATQKPSTLIWCMGATQKTSAPPMSAPIPSCCWPTGIVGQPGTVANIFRGHTNVQGATDLGLDIATPARLLRAGRGGWRTSPASGTCVRVSALRSHDKKFMESPGIPSTRWFDAVTLPQDQIEQPKLRAMMVFGHGGNTVSRMAEMVKGLEALDLLVIADPHPTTYSQVSNRRDGTYLLPICTNFETVGSRTASNRSLQWGFQIVNPIFETRNDYDVLYDFATRFGFGAEMFKHIGRTPDNHIVVEDILREANRGMWAVGYTGQSPERLKAHMDTSSIST
jgi:formate dehydrogenase major subunit